MTGSVILSLAYGIDVQEENDPYIDIVERNVHVGALEGAFGRYLVVSFDSTLQANHR